MPESLKQLRKKRERLKREIDKLDWQIALGMDSPVDATAMISHEKHIMGYSGCCMMRRLPRSLESTPFLKRPAAD